MKKPAVAKAYHHGDLRLALLDAARTLLEQEGLSGLSLRAVARRAGVSHAAPYRHFPNREALLSELAIEGFGQLKSEITLAAAAPGETPDRVANIGGAYMRFAARKPALIQLMFGPQFPNREQHAELSQAVESIGQEIGSALSDPVLGLAVWAAVHGLAMLILDNVIDLGQRRAGSDVLPSRAEILLRSLFTMRAG